MNTSISLREEEIKSLPRRSMTCRNSVAEIKPLPSLSKTLNASFISSSGFESCTFRDIIVRNSEKSIVPLPSASISLIMSNSSASVGFCPSARITVPSSRRVILPSPSVIGFAGLAINSCSTSGGGEPLSKSLKASANSAQITISKLACPLGKGETYPKSVLFDPCCITMRESSGRYMHTFRLVSRHK